MRSPLRVLGVVAHPDDEAWALGGALALCAERSADVRVLCATRGEAGQDHLGGRTGAALAAGRTEELRRSCVILGVREPVVLDLPDGGLGADAAGWEASGGAGGRGGPGERALRAAMERLDPDVILTLGPDGGYGHHDHQAVTRWVGEGGGRARVLHRVFLRGLLFPVWQGLRRAGFAGIDAGKRPEDFGALDGEGGAGGGGRELRIDVSSTLDRRRAAVAAHRSQRRGEDPDTFLLPGLLSSLGPVERYVIVGPEPLPDPLEHLLGGRPPGSAR